jgi:probable F420-dependent oxidoreductase
MGARVFSALAGPRAIVEPGAVYTCEKRAAMRFGIHLTHYRSAGADEPAIDFAVRAEELGYDSVWAGDHVVNPEHVDTVYPHTAPGIRRTTQASGGMPDPFVLLGIIAGKTGRVRLGFDVLIAPYRPPLLASKMIATLDALSGGRVIAGIGAGWHEQEFEALGVPFHERGPRTDEAVAVWKKVWSGENVAFEGRFQRFDSLRVLPRPLQPGGPPIWMGGDGPWARKSAAAYADGWLPTFISADRYREQYAAIREAALRNGRPAPLAATQQRTLITDTPYVYSDDELLNPYRPLAGTPDQIIAVIRDFEAAGAQYFVLTRTGESPEALAELMERFAREVMPAFR